MMEDPLPSIHKYTLDTSKNGKQTHLVSSIDSNEFYMDWYTLVGDFTKRHLARPSDKLAAIGGIARRMQNHTTDEYCAGLWWNDLIFGLLWVYTEDARPLGDANLCSDQPSWNWTSLNAPVWWCFWLPRWDRTYGSTYKELAQVEDTYITYSGQSLYGSIAKGELVITGPCYFTNLCRSNSGALSDQEPPKFDQMLVHSLRYNQEFQKRHRHYHGQIFAIIQVAQIERDVRGTEKYSHTEVAVLVLESIDQPRLPSPNDPEVIYKRVGLVILADPAGRDSYPGSGNILVLEKHEKPAKERFAWPQRMVRII